MCLTEAHGNTCLNRVVVRMKWSDAGTRFNTAPNATTAVYKLLLLPAGGGYPRGVALPPPACVLVLVQAQIFFEVQERFMCERSFGTVGGMGWGGIKIRRLIFIKSHLKSDS